MADSRHTTASRYHAMSVWDLTQVLTTLVAVRQLYNLTCCAEPNGETAVFEWSEDQEAAVDAEILGAAESLASRLNLGADEENYRDMAFKRIDGFVPSYVAELLLKAA